MNELAWTCHVCGDERPDELIAVYSSTWRARDGGLAGVEVKQNVRYCADRPACLEGARSISFLATGQAEPYGFELVEPVLGPALAGFEWRQTTEVAGYWSLERGDVEVCLEPQLFGPWLLAVYVDGELAHKAKLSLDAVVPGGPLLELEASS